MPLKALEVGPLANGHSGFNRFSTLGRCGRSPFEDRYLNLETGLGLRRWRFSKPLQMR